MKKKTKYVLNRNSKYSKYAEMVLDISFDIKKRLSDGFGIIKLYDEDFVAFTVKTSLDKHFKKLLEFIIKIEEDDDDPPSSLMVCLNEADKIRKEILNKYARMLDKKQQDFLEKKLEIIEKDIKNKLIAYRLSMMTYNARIESPVTYEEEMIEERHRRR